MATNFGLHSAHSASPTSSQGDTSPQPQQNVTAGSGFSHSEVGEASAGVEGNYPGTATSIRERYDEINDDKGEFEEGEFGEAEFGEAEGSEDAEDDQPQVPLSAAIQTMANVGSLTVLHDDLGELDAGYASYYQQRRKLTVANDDYAELNNNNTSYVRRVYVAITTTPAPMDDEQTKMADVLTKKLKTFKSDADQFLADISSMVISAIYNLHSEGDFLFGPQFEALKPRKLDSTMTATERVDVICDQLHACKKHVVDLMEGSDAITRFVAAPLGASDRKARYKGSNTKRAAKNRQMKQLMEAENEAESGADE